MLSMGVKWQLWHHVVQGETAVMNQYRLNNVSCKEELVLYCI